MDLNYLLLNRINISRFRQSLSYLKPFVFKSVQFDHRLDFNHSFYYLLLSNVQTDYTIPYFHVCVLPIAPTSSSIKLPGILHCVRG